MMPGGAFFVLIGAQNKIQILSIENRDGYDGALCFGTNILPRWELKMPELVTKSNGY
jgi:hypothetical protein